MQGDQIEPALLAEGFNRPTLLLRRDSKVTQHGMDLNRLAVVTAVIFAKLFHAENFTQRRQDANEFYSLISVAGPAGSAPHTMNSPRQSSSACGLGPNGSSPSIRSRE